MISLVSNGEQSSELMELIKKFPTSAFVAERLHEVGLGSDYGQSLLKSFQGGASLGMWGGVARGTRTFPSVQTTLPKLNGQMPLRYRFLNGSGRNFAGVV
jgi:hypothetical protein